MINKHLQNNLCTLFFLVMLFTACTGKKKDLSNLPFPEGYNMQQYQKFKLSEDLDEISGIAYNTKLNRILAIQDEDGDVYHINASNGDEINHFEFGKSGDYEDLAVSPAGWYYLKSNGNLYFAGDTVEKEMKAEKIDYPRKGDEFEGLYYDKGRNALMLMCKNCEIDKKSAASVYAYFIDKKTFSDEPVARIQLADVNRKLQKPLKEYRPAAAALHPITGKLFVLSSAQRVLVVATPEGRVEHAFKLDKKLFKQAEGICFDPKGDMFISNEAGEGYANILRFAYKP